MKRLLPLVLVALAAVGCATQMPESRDLRYDTPATSPSYAPGPTYVGRSYADAIAQLAVNDRPHTDADYRRDEWPHWLDLDHDGRDTRQQLIDLNRRPDGTWLSEYDNQTFTDPRKMDVDHVVPLAEAHRSGGYAWETYQRADLANNPANLRLVSAKSNRSKGDKTPDQWRPPSQAAWCEYARSYVYVKAHYHLTVTTAERDALGQMLDTCTP